MRLAAVLAVALAVAALGAGAGTTAGARDARKGQRLERFRSCGELLAYARRHTLRLVGPWGFGGPPPLPAPPGTPVPVRQGAPTAGIDFSRTNVQEADVDEPDLVKTDGEHLFAVGEGRLQAIAVGVRPRHLDSLPLRTGAGHELLLHGDRVIVLSRGGGEFLPLRQSLGYTSYSNKTIVTEVDVHDPSSLRVLSRFELDGGYASARLVGGTLRVVLVSQLPRALPLQGPTGSETSKQAAARNRAVVRRSRLRNWMPSRLRTDVRRKIRAKRPLVRCNGVRKPPTFSGLGLLTVLTLELERGLHVADSDAVFADGQIVYSSTTGLYVATQRWSDVPGEAGITTPLHKFDVSKPGRTEYRGSGVVPGFLVNQWALDEYEGRLRVASTNAPAWWGGPGGESESFVTVLEEEAGKLVPVGRVGGLGKGERIYAVRFLDDVAYVVTFREVDPLYTVDLSSPRRPLVLGELKIRGYSSYLHPLGGDLLLGIGQDATARGQTLGTQLSVFDVGDLRRPVRLHRRTIRGGGSEAEYDHHAFLYWPRTGLTVVPVQAAREAVALGFRVGRGGIGEVGRVTHGRPEAPDPIRRSVVVGDGLYTVSGRGVKASELGTLAPRAWIAFRRVPSSQVSVRPLVLAVVVLLCCGCGGGDDETDRPQPPAQTGGSATQGRLSARPSDSVDDEDEAGLRTIGAARLYVPAGEGPRTLVVTLHGAGGGPDEAIQLLRPHADRAGLILLAPKSEAATWDVAQGGFGPDVAAIDRLLTQVFSQHDVDDVAVAGFSDGASYALSIGLTNGDLFRSVIAFSPGFIAFAAPTGMPRLFISHGTADPILPIGRTSRRGVPRLRGAGYSVKYREFEGGHEVPPGVAREAVEWLRRG